LDSRRDVLDSKDMDSHRGKILGGESWRRFLWPSLQCEKELCVVGHRDLFCHMSVWWQLS